jgi:predicted RNase H-like HicB family nuclease
MAMRTKGPYVEVVPVDEGIYRATSPTSEGLYAEGTTPQEAERNLLDLIEKRIAERGPVAAKDPVELDPDGGYEPPEEG